MYGAEFSVSSVASADPNVVAIDVVRIRMAEDLRQLHPGPGGCGEDGSGHDMSIGNFTNWAGHWCSDSSSLCLQASRH